MINFKSVYYIILAFSLIFISSSSCKKESDESLQKRWENKINALYEHNNLKITLNHGIAGSITMITGNCMPPIDSSECKSFPIKRKVSIHRYTMIEDLEGFGPLYNKVNSQFITDIETDEEGFFQTEVEPGNYSIFIIGNGKYYASLFDGIGGANPVSVKFDSVIVFNTTINYAVY